MLLPLIGTIWVTVSALIVVAVFNDHIERELPVPWRVVPFALLLPPVAILLSVALGAFWLLEQCEPEAWAEDARARIKGEWP